MAQARRSLLQQAAVSAAQRDASLAAVAARRLLAVQAKGDRHLSHVTLCNHLLDIDGENVTFEWMLRKHNSDRSSAAGC